MRFLRRNSLLLGVVSDSVPSSFSRSIERSIEKWIFIHVTGRLWLSTWKKIDLSIGFSKPCASRITPQKFVKNLGEITNWTRAHVYNYIRRRKLQTRLHSCKNWRENFHHSLGTRSIVDLSQYCTQTQRFGRSKVLRRWRQICKWFIEVEEHDLHFRQHFSRIRKLCRSQKSQWRPSISPARGTWSVFLMPFNYLRLEGFDTLWLSRASVSRKNYFKNYFESPSIN